MASQKSFLQTNGSLSASILVVSILALIGAGCQTGSDTSKVVEDSTIMATKDLHHFPEPEPKPESTPHHDPALLNPVYRIGPGDVLDFRIFDDESLNNQVVVRYDGYISLPMIPDVLVADRTRAEAEQLLFDAYSSVYLEPQLSLSVVTSHSRTYHTMGSVSSPGEYPYVRPITLLEAINSSGGLRVNQRGGDSYVGAQGQLTQAIVIRHVEGKREVRNYDISNLTEEGAHAADTPIYPGDVVYVPEGVNLVYLLGEVAAPNVFELRQGMTLLQLLAQAGGFSESTARLKSVVLMRQIDEKETRIDVLDVRQMLKTGADPLLQAGDVIYLPKKRLTRASEFVSRFTSSVSPVLDLYMKAYDAYYTDERYDRLYNDTNSTDFLQLQQLLNDLSTFSGILTP